MTHVAELWLACSVEPWRRMGFASVDTPRGPVISVAGLNLRFVEVNLESPIVGWTLVTDGQHDVADIDGIATEFIPTSFMEDMAPVSSEGHALSVTGIDHVVINTGSLDRTCGVIEQRLGLPLKRVRDAGHGVRQGFHRAGAIILEVVERPDLEPSTPASLWGLVFNVDDIDAAAAWFGPDAISSPKDAVQSGRRIATVRSGAGLVVPLALMSGTKA